MLAKRREEVGPSWLRLVHQVGVLAGPRSYPAATVLEAPVALLACRLAAGEVAGVVAFSLPLVRAA